MKVLYKASYSYESAILDIEDKLQTYYELIDCDTIDMVFVDFVDGHRISAIVDDNYLLTHKVYRGLVDYLSLDSQDFWSVERPFKLGTSEEDGLLFGVVIFVSDDGYGNCQGLSDKQVDYLRNRLAKN